MSSDWRIFKLQLAALVGLLFLSVAVTWVILYYVRLLDHPNERSSHTLATPKCGGVGVVVSFIAGVYLSQLWGDRYIVHPAVLYSLIMPVLLVASVSLADDIQELSPKVRLIVQLIAALLFIGLVGLGGTASGSGLLSPVMQILTWFVGVVWIVGMANAFNFMDGIDGLAAGQGLIAAFFFSVYQFGQGGNFLAFVALVLMVGCLGFLAFNFPPAKVFMGDVGSVSIGFIMGAMAVLGYKFDPTLKSLIIVPLLMANFIFDVTLTLTRRIINKESLLKPHRSHLYQIFSSCGFSHRTVTMTNYGMAILQGILVITVESQAILIILCLSMQVCYYTAIRYWRFKSEEMYTS